MSNPDGSGMGAGFAIRMTILLVLLACVGVGALFEKVILPSQHKTQIDKVMDLIDSEEAKIKATGVRIGEVRETIGFEPYDVLDDKANNFIVESYKYNRIFSSDELKIVHRDEAVLKAILNQEYDPTEIEAIGKVYQPPKEERVPISIGGGGAPRPKGNDKKEGADSDEEKSEDEKSDDKKSDE